MFIALVCLVAFTACMQPESAKTIADLKEGIKGEMTASAKYAAFALKAKQEGNFAIAKLFDAASMSESIHALNHKRILILLGETMDDFKPEFTVKTTAEIVQDAIDGESYEVNTMYPRFIRHARTEKLINAERSFSWALDTEKKHHQFYTNALRALKMNVEKALPSGYAVCPVCGNTYKAGIIDDRCAFCQTGKESFILF